MKKKSVAFALVVAVLLVLVLAGTALAYAPKTAPVLDPGNIPSWLPKEQMAWHFYLGDGKYNIRLWVSWDKNAGQPTYLKVYQAGKQVARVKIIQVWADQGYGCIDLKQDYAVGTTLKLRLGNTSGYDEETVSVIDPPVS